MISPGSIALPATVETSVNDGRIVVFLVDDQAIIGEAVRRAVANEPDIEFHYCGVGGEAVAMAAALRPTVIMQDLVMPDVDGMTLIHVYQMHPALRHVPIIVLSSKEDAAVKSLAFATGAVDYLVKLPENIELIARIRHHSRAYINQLQRDAAYRALRENQQQLMQINEALRRLSDVDGLTGLSNRRNLDAYLEAEWRRAVRDREDFSILMIDVDDFKLYNDTCGHLAGDEVLKQVAKVMQQCAHRPADLAARYGGEEFAMVLPSTSQAGAKRVADQICANVRGLSILPDASSGMCVTVSVGAATAVPSRGESYAPLLDAADAALYEAKRAGKNRVVSHELS
ncbi:response regulator receiver modulated diguanylate cyclase [Rhodanobacter sp. OK091]|nr:response regulator receiver modulated diguanylate cyclase [Rhodanobacter sp. OK091]